MKYLFDATSELLRKALFVNTPLIFHFNLYMHFDREELYRATHSVTLYLLI